MNIQKVIALVVMVCTAGTGSLKPIQVTDNPNLQIGLLVQGLAAIGTTAAQIAANKFATDTTIEGRQKHNQLKLLARVGKTVTDASMLHNTVLLVPGTDAGAFGIMGLVAPLVMSDLINLGRDVHRIAAFKYTPLSADEVEAASVALQSTGHSAEVALNVCAGLELACNLAFIAHAAMRSGVADVDRSSAYFRKEPELRTLEQIVILNSLFLTRIVPHIVDAGIQKNITKKLLWGMALGLAATSEIGLLGLTYAAHAAHNEYKATHCQHGVPNWSYPRCAQCFSPAADNTSSSSTWNAYAGASAGTSGAAGSRTAGNSYSSSGGSGANSRSSARQGSCQHGFPDIGFMRCPICYPDADPFEDFNRFFRENNYGRPSGTGSSAYTGGTSSGARPSYAGASAGTSGASGSGYAGRTNYNNYGSNTAGRSSASGAGSSSYTGGRASAPGASSEYRQPAQENSANYRYASSYTKAPQPVRAEIDAMFNAPNGAAATKLYRKAQLKYHPDKKGGTAEHSKAINAAWEAIKTKFGLS